MVEWDFFSGSLRDLFYDPVTGKITVLHIISDLALVLIPVVIVVLLWWWIRKKTKGSG